MVRPAAYISVLFFALLISMAGNAQERNYQYFFLSKVVSDSTNSAVSNCHVINHTQRIVTVTGFDGLFRLSAEVGDEITFSCIGFEKLNITVHDSLYAHNTVIRLKSTTYELKEVEIEGTRKPLVSKFEVYTKPLPNQGGINIPTGISPVTLLYNLLSKEGKQKRHYRKIMEGTGDSYIIAEKYNGETVSKLTGLKDDELVKFMAYCNFSREFLRYMSPATITREIMAKYKEYSKN